MRYYILILLADYAASNCLHKVNDGNTSKRCEICIKASNNDIGTTALT